MKKNKQSKHEEKLWDEHFELMMEVTHLARHVAEMQFNITKMHIRMNEIEVETDALEARRDNKIN